MLRIIVYSLIFYFLYKVIKYFMRLMSPENNAPAGNEVKEDASSKPQYRIEEKDIIDADFTEIKEKDEENKKQ